ncbi:MAG: SxtJ family membrane protein [Desulfobulbaceae bacterium]|nr:SxtJ family membrane protein [Desulfobulbaceae bacterium]
MAKKNDSNNQAKDTGLAMVLILLLLAHFGKFHASLLPAIVVLVITMTWPAFFAPLAKLWFGLSHLLGGVVSKVLLTIVFFLVATPIAFLRRLGGADAMRRKDWKGGGQSAFVERGHEFSRKDLETPY